MVEERAVHLGRPFDVEQVRGVGENGEARAGDPVGDLAQVLVALCDRS